MDKNLTNFTEWLDWIFARKVSKPIWFFEKYVNYTASSETTLKHLIGLFNNPEQLLEKYSLEQIQQGFWVIAGAGGIMSAALTDDRPSLNDKVNCIYEMENVFLKIFSEYPMDDVCYIWWDDLTILTSDFEDGTSVIPTDVVNAKAIRESIFEVLSKIIFIPVERCQVSALHALGHLQHPDKKKLIFKYLNSGLEISDETREYSRSCIAGDVL